MVNGQERHQETISLQHHIEGQIESLRELCEARFDAMDKALEVSIDTLNNRFDNTNEWRGLVTDQLSKSVTRASCEERHQRDSEDIRSLRESRAEVHGKASQASVLIVTIISIIGLLIALANTVMRTWK